MNLGSVTPKQMEHVYQQLVDRGLLPDMMTENAAFVLADHVRTLLGGLPGRSVVALVGANQLAAPTLASCRRLAGWGAKPTVLLGDPRSALQPEAEQHLALAEPYGVRVFEPGALMPPAELVLDGLTDCQFHGSLTGTAAELASTASRLKVPILAVDVPSGLDATTGKADQPVIRADVTTALGYPKTGLVKPFAKNLVGQLLVADLGIPPNIWRQFGQPAPDFSAGPVMQVG